MTNRLRYRIILSSSSRFLVFTDDSNSPTMLKDCSNLIFCKPGAITELRRQHSSNDKFTFINHLDHYPDLRIQIWEQEGQHCLGVGDYRRKIDGVWEYIEGFEFHPMDLDSFFENIKLPIVTQLGKFSRGTELLYSFFTLNECAKQELPITFKRLILKGFEQEVKNWVEQEETEVKEAIRYALEESLLELLMNYNLKHSY